MVKKMAFKVVDHDVNKFTHGPGRYKWHVILLTDLDSDLVKYLDERGIGRRNSKKQWMIDYSDLLPPSFRNISGDAKEKALEAFKSTMSKYDIDSEIGIV